MKIGDTVAWANPITKTKTARLDIRRSLGTVHLLDIVDGEEFAQVAWDCPHSSAKIRKHWNMVFWCRCSELVVTERPNPD